MHAGSNLTLFPSSSSFQDWSNIPRTYSFDRVVIYISDVPQSDINWLGSPKIFKWGIAPSLEVINFISRWFPLLEIHVEQRIMCVSPM